MTDPQTPEPTPAVEAGRCIVITDRHTRCKGKTRPGAEFCGRHGGPRSDSARSVTAPEPTPLEAAGFAWWSVHMHVGTWADESPQNRAYYAEQAAKILGPALAGDWLDREIERHSDASTRLDAWVCTSCGAALNVVSPGPGTLEDRVAAGVIAHQAAAIRAAVSGYGL